MKQIIKWGGLGILLTLSIFAVVFLPEHAAKKYDAGYLNGYKLYEQDTSLTVNTDLSLEEKLAIIAGYEEQSSIVVMQIEDEAELLKNDDQLFTELEKQLMLLEEKELIHGISSGLDLEEAFINAELYAYTSMTNPGKVFYAWEMEFLQPYAGEYQCNMLVDAVSYKIYQMSIYGDWEELPYIYNAERDFDTMAGVWFSGYIEYLHEGMEEDVEISVRVENYSVWAFDEELDFYGYLTVDELTYCMTVEIMADGIFFHVDGNSSYNEKTGTDSSSAK